MASPSHEDSTASEFCLNEEALESNWSTQPSLPSQHQQLLDLSSFKFHRNKDSDVCSQHSALEGTALNALSPEIQNNDKGQTQTSRSTVILCATNEDATISNFSSQHIPLNKEQLLEHFSKNHTAVNTSSPRISNTCSETQTSQTQEKGKLHSNFKYTVDSTISYANPQSLGNFYDQTLTTGRYTQHSIETIIGKKTAEYSRIDSQDGPIDLSVSSTCRSHLPQSFPENLISDRNATGARNKFTNCSAEPFKKRGNLSTRNFSLQQGAHFSGKPTKLEDAEKPPTAYAPPAECYASPATNPSFESARECTRNVKKEISFPMHAYEKQILLKGDHTPNVFHHESSVREHRAIPVDERPFKCVYCEEYEGKKKGLLISHMLKWHHSLFSNRELNCRKCLWQFVTNSKPNVDVPSNNYDPKNFKCDLCSEEFFCEHKLNHHYNTVHKEEKPFKCNKCPYASTSRDNLTMHQNARHKELL